MNIIRPVAKGAYLYYADDVIRGVSFTEQDTPYDRLIIPIEVATKFITGEYSTRDWVIWTSTAGTCAYSRDAQVQLVDLADTFTPIVSTTSPVMLTLKLYRKAQRIIVQNNSVIHVETPAATLPFIFAVRNDPSAVLHSLDVPVATLLANGMVELPLPIDPDVPLTVYTRCLFPNYQIENITDDADLELALPAGHFIDLIKFEQGKTERGLQAVLRPAERRLRLSLMGQAIETYDRRTRLLRLLFSMPDDPSLMLHADSVDAAALREGITLSLPAILDRPFDLWAPLLYRRVAIFSENE